MNTPGHRAITAPPAQACTIVHDPAHIVHQFAKSCYDPVPTEDRGNEGGKRRFMGGRYGPACLRPYQEAGRTIPICCRNPAWGGVHVPHRTTPAGVE